MAFSALLFLVGLIAGCGHIPTPSGTNPASPTGPWHQVDVGNVGVQGYMDEQSGGKTFVVYGAGKDIWGTSDSFHFGYQLVSGDATITAHVTSIKQVENWTKAGVMMRASSAADAKYAYVLLTAQNGTDMQVRQQAGASQIEPGMDYSIRPPYWLRLTREGDTFTGYQSADGKTWTKLGSATVSMPQDVMVGLAVTSRSETQLAEGVFDNVDVQAASVSPPTTNPPTTNPPTDQPSTDQTVTYKTDSTGIFPNPERGWYAPATPGSYGGIYDKGYTLAFNYVRLDNYRNAPLPTSFLDNLKSDLASARGAGVKVVLRFTYNFGDAPDAPLSIVQKQLSQLTPILHDNADVIAVMQAGFIGYWGEWHHSTNDLGTLDNRTKVINAVLNALPTTRMTAIRTPFRAYDIFPTPPDASTAFDGSNASRVGQHNDCFLSDATDGGTFQSSSDYSYAKKVSLYTAMGGETCSIGGLWSRNDCSTALQELSSYHYDYLNEAYWSNILDKWKSQGCYDEISRRLGYRFSLTKVIAPSSVSPGQSLGMSITMQNTGFGKLYNPRPLQLVFVPTAGGNDVTVTVNSDVRRLLPGPGDTATIDVSSALPSGTPSGTYDVYLNLPDASPKLNSDPRYSIRLADQNTWVSNNGYNDLGLQVTVN